MPNYSFDQYREIFNSVVEQYKEQPFYKKLIDQFGPPHWPDNALECAAFGIRHDGKDKDHRDDIADDSIVLCRLNEDNQPEVLEAIGTTESGLFTKIINAEGDFKMYPGFYFFKKGAHKGVNPCLVQAGLVRGERAKKHQDYDGGEWTDTGGTIHIHAGIMNPQRVADWSAGCQVIAGGWMGRPWVNFFGACKQSKQSIYPYILADEADVKKLFASPAPQ